jgi:hypothetical protein
VINPDELEIKDTTESDIHVSASYLGILLNIDLNGRLITTLYDKRCDFCNRQLSFLCSNITFTCLWCVYLPVDSTRKGMFRELFKARPITKQKLMLHAYNESRLKS